MSFAEAPMIDEEFSPRNPIDVLNQLLHLGKVNWVTQLPGLSLLRELEFGLFERIESKRSHSWIGNRLAGLTIKSQAIRNLRLLGDPAHNQLDVWVDLAPSEQIVVSKTVCANESRRPLVTIENCFGIDGSPPPRPWLDEWENCDHPCAGCAAACSEKSKQISDWSDLILVIETEDLTVKTQLCPTWTDRDRSILRIFDSRHQQAIYVDLSSRHLSLTETSSRSGILHFSTLTPN